MFSTEILPGPKKITFVFNKMFLKSNQFSSLDTKLDGKTTVQQSVSLRGGCILQNSAVIKSADNKTKAL
jgi:hypothetical protein